MVKEPLKTEKKDVAGPTEGSSKQPQPQPKSPVTSAKVEAPKKVEAKPPAKPESRPISFDRWFASKNFKPHWKAGMAAFTDTSVRRSVEAWDEVFGKY